MNCRPLRFILWYTCTGAHKCRYNSLFDPEIKWKLDNKAINRDVQSVKPVWIDVIDFQVFGTYMPNRTQTGPYWPILALPFCALSLTALLGKWVHWSCKPAKRFLESVTFNGCYGLKRSFILAIIFQMNSWNLDLILEISTFQSTWEQKPPLVFVLFSWVAVTLLL